MSENWSCRIWFEMKCNSLSNSISLFSHTRWTVSSVDLKAQISNLRSLNVSKLNLREQYSLPFATLCLFKYCFLAAKLESAFRSRKQVIYLPRDCNNRFKANISQPFFNFSLLKIKLFSENNNKIFI